MTEYKTNVQMILTHTLVPYVHSYLTEFIRERTWCFLLWRLLDGATITVDIFQGCRKQQQHDDAANHVLQLIIEEIYVTMRKDLEMEAKFNQIDSNNHAAVTLVWFQNIMQLISHSIQKIKGDPYWNNHHRRHSKLPSFFIDCSKRCNSLCWKGVLDIFDWEDSSLLSPLKFILVYHNHQHLSRKSNRSFGSKICCQLLQTNYKQSCQFYPYHQVTLYNVLFICYHQNNSFFNLRLLNLVNWYKNVNSVWLIDWIYWTTLLAYMSCKPVWDMNQEFILFKSVTRKEGHFSVKAECDHQYLDTPMPLFYALETTCFFIGDSTVKIVLGNQLGPLLTWMDLNEIATLIKKEESIVIMSLF